MIVAIKEITSKCFVWDLQSSLFQNRDLLLYCSKFFISHANYP